MMTQETLMCITLGSPIWAEPALATLACEKERFLPNAGDWHPELIEAPRARDGLVTTRGRGDDAGGIRNECETWPAIRVSRVLLNHPQATWHLGMAGHHDRCLRRRRDHGQQAGRIACARRQLTLMLDV